jgi:hypothetical protein
LHSSELAPVEPDFQHHPIAKIAHPLRIGDALANP